MPLKFSVLYSACDNALTKPCSYVTDGNDSLDMRGTGCESPLNLLVLEHMQKLQGQTPPKKTKNNLHGHKLYNDLWMTGDTVCES